LANRLGVAKIGVLRKIYGSLQRIVFCCQVPVSTQIGDGVVFGHNGFGVIVNGKSTIGRNCFFGSSVLIGGQPNRPGVPHIGNDCVIHAGAKILGPINIGDGAVIGANAVITKDVPAASLAVGSPMVIAKENVDHRRYRPNSWQEFGYEDTPVPRSD
jgi:serine O-acetyltransferase